MQRITEKMIEARIKWLNELTDSPEKPWVRKDNESTAQIGNYHISFAYGGVSLHRMLSTHGSIDDVFRCGHIPKRELFDRVCAFMEGIHVESERVGS